MKESHSVLSFCHYILDKNKRKKAEEGKGFFVCIENGNS